MEKIWLRYFRVITLCALGGVLVPSNRVYAQDVEVRSVVVDVEVPVAAGNLASAKQAAQKAAFEKALDQLLSASMDPGLRAEKLKRASHSIKSFQVVSENLEGSTLKQRYKCEVSFEPDMVTAPITDLKITFEVAWLPDDVQFNAVDLLKYVSEVMGTPASSVRIGRGNIVLALALKKSLEETQNQLASFVGRRGMVKVLRRDESRPPDMLPQPIPMPVPPSFQSEAPSVLNQTRPALPQAPLPQLLQPNATQSQLPPQLPQLPQPNAAGLLPQSNRDAPVLSLPVPQNVPAEPASVMPTPMPFKPAQPNGGEATPLLSPKFE